VTVVGAGELRQPAQGRRWLARPPSYTASGSSPRSCLPPSHTNLFNPALVPLRPEERALLQATADAGGRYTIRGLPLLDMVQKAGLLLRLQQDLLVKSKIHFNEAIQPDVIDIEITDEGRRVLQSDA
jgi:hypothetical protein